MITNTLKIFGYSSVSTEFSSHFLVDTFFSVILFGNEVITLTEHFMIFLTNSFYNFNWSSQSFAELHGVRYDINGSSQQTCGRDLPLWIGVPPPIQQYGWDWGTCFFRKRAYISTGKWYIFKTFNVIFLFYFVHWLQIYDYNWFLNFYYVFSSTLNMLAEANNLWEN